MTADRRRVALGTRWASSAVVVALAAFAVVVSAPVAASASPAPAMALSVGTRLTWHAGESTTEGAKLVPDPNGWIERDGQWYRLESSGGSGGVGVKQLDLVEVSAERIVGDLRTYLNTDLAADVYVPSGSSVVVGDAGALPGFWTSPDRLAALTPQADASTRVTRGERVVGGQAVATVSVATSGAGTYSSETYDAASGILLFSGSVVTSAGVNLFDPSGNLQQQFAGSVHTEHNSFADARQVAAPWTSGAPPGWVVPGASFTYSGQWTPPSTGLGQLPGQAIEVIQTVERVDGAVAVVRQVVRSATTTGMPPSESTSSRVFASTMADGLWIPAEAFASLMPGTTLDHDELTRRTTVFQGVEGSSAVIVSTGPADQLLLFYDVRSGMLVASRAQKTTPGVGTDTVELVLVQS